MFVSILRIVVFVKTLNFELSMCCIGDIGFWIEYVLNWRYWILDFGFGSSKWILVVQQQLNFSIGQQLFAAAILKKKKTGTYQRGNNCVCMCHTSAVPSTTALVCVSFVIFAQSEPFFNAISKEPRWYVILSITVVQPHLYLQYFLLRLDNHTCKPYKTAIKCLFSTSVYTSFEDTSIHNMYI